MMTGTPIMKERNRRQKEHPWEIHLGKQNHC